LILESIATRSFRNLADAEWRFHPSVNVLFGDNGQGKTNVLEAIHVLGCTKSFRTARVQNVVRVGESSMFVAGSTNQQNIRRSLSIGLSSADGRRRELQINEQKSSIDQYLTVLHLLVYSSSQLEILRGGPEWRRRFVDRGIASIDPSHLGALTRYSKVVRQRNALVDDIRKGGARAATLDAWDEELVVAARPVVDARRRFVADLEREFREIVSAHDYHVSDIAMAYSPATLSGELDADRAAVRELRPRDLKVGFSTAGPHRDAIDLTRSSLPAAEMLSSGEIKMTVLFLTLAAMEIYRRKFESRPILLLDDLDAELDLRILQRLLRYLIGSTQIFTTSAKEPILEKLDLGPHRRFILERGSAKLTTDVHS
jgi:DNA replication and repair protein RecF